MGWQEGLMLLGGAVLIAAIVYKVHRKGVRSLEEDYDDLEEEARRAELARELPSIAIDGKEASVQRGLDPLFDDIAIFDDDPIPVLRNKQPTAESLQAAFAGKLELDDETSDDELAWAKMRRMFAVDPAFAEASRSSIEEQQKELQQLQAKKNTLAKVQQVQALLEQQALATQYLEEQSNKDAMDNYNNDDLVELQPINLQNLSLKQQKQALEEQLENALNEDFDDVEQHLEKQYLENIEPLAQPDLMVEIDPEEREKNLRTALLANLEKNAWGSSEVFLTINVNAPSEQPFMGDHLAKFMDMIGMKLSETGFYHYVEEKDGQPYLGFSMVNMFSPGCFSEDMDEDYTTAGVVLVMPLPNTPLPMAVFERMLATAKVMEQNWGAELQDEQRSNLTQQTIEHYRQTIKDFEYQTRVNAKKAGRI
ncbi:MAG TPA: cell division protein ZipA C-terminal FtsZ-binding domain-containing protein [Marinospirillum sp.]|uniref:cell division protein ZipA C-terminal FtsZ-binding domain-containing protein n=1 Tax=Marinospirillum sp. TaxID=2183934 RepID=UPI002B4834BA|nr:cell division protein ZipA C-terminal FtsZ-binding domain-containing protein [Marinospirillum sp.]HKM16403.1 cell division protein ZipA C-terminal FtsZ-binding domain-containing protein [Marinospirillum sp.]